MFNEGSNSFENVQQFIHEMLNDSAKAKKLYDMLVKIYKDYIDDYKGNLDNKSQFYIIGHDFTKIVEDKAFASIVTLCNYYIVSYNDNEILFHLWHPEDCTDTIYNNYGGKVCHLTTKENWNKIKIKGLSGKGKGMHQVHLKDKEKEQWINDKLASSYRPQQTYVLVGDINSDKSKQQAKMMIRSLKRFKESYISWRVINKKTQEKMIGDLSDYVILEIDLSIYKNKLKIYRDPSCTGYPAYFISEYVPAFIISKLDIEL